MGHCGRAALVCGPESWVAVNEGFPEALEHPPHICQTWEGWRGAGEIQLHTLQVPGDKWAATWRHTAPPGMQKPKDRAGKGVTLHGWLGWGEGRAWQGSKASAHKAPPRARESCSLVTVLGGWTWAGEGVGESGEA